MTAIVLRGDARRLPLPDACADLIVTSPPFWQLRSYTDGGVHYDGQVGSEPTPGEYVDSLLACTREWVRILKPSGSLFVELGDKYSGAGRGNNTGAGLTNPLKTRMARYDTLSRRQQVGTETAPPKSLIGLPWRYAIRCIDELGLILRAEIPWHHVNGLPESVTDRVRRAHSTVFHFTVRPRYYAAVDEIREPHTGTAHPQKREPVGSASGNGVRHRTFAGQTEVFNPLGKLPGSVWEIPSQPLSVPAGLGVDHFAAFPMELPRRVILGWSPPGICTACGEGRRPVSMADPADTRSWALSQRQGRAWHGDGTDPKRALGVPAADRSRHITGYACGCPDATAPVRPAVVVDPFGGTGTTALVASMLGRTGISVDLSMDYARLAKWRTTDPAERARALQVPKPPPVPDGQGSLFDGLEAS